MPDIRPGQRWRCKAHPEILVAVTRQVTGKDIWVVETVANTRALRAGLELVLSPAQLRELYTLEDEDG